MNVDGSYYIEDIKEIFPNHIQDKILGYSSAHIDELIKEIEQKAKDYY